MTAGVADLLRELVPQVLGILVRRHGQFETCEDVVQEALLEAAVRWPEQGVLDNPRAWLLTVASRRLTDQWRSEQARRRREVAVAGLEAPDVDTRDPDVDPDADDTLALLFLCCHPALPEPSQLALTLRAVGGLSTAEIARAFLVPEPTMAQRISRAKQRIRAAGSTFAMPPAEQLTDRLRVVLRVLYLIFNEGYTASSGAQLHRTELTAEAIRLTRIVHRLRPADGEVAGLLALMLLTDARRATRTTADGGLVPISEQDRDRWDRAAIAEGVALVSGALAVAAPGPYQLQAAIAALHVEAPRAEDTDWPQILVLYRLLARFDPSPMVRLNEAVALAMVAGPRSGLELLDTLGADDRLAEHHRLAAVRAHLLEQAGDADGAREQYLLAARRATSLPEQRYLRAREARLRR
jgi:RNA polymerase sigma factor (sigma-70 family)